MRLGAYRKMCIDSAKSGKISIMVATLHRKPQMLVDTITKFGLEILESACEHGNTNIIRFLQRNYDDVANVTEKLDRRCYHLAAVAPKPKDCSLLWIFHEKLKIRPGDTIADIKAVETLAKRVKSQCGTDSFRLNYMLAHGFLMTRPAVIHILKQTKHPQKPQAYEYLQKCQNTRVATSIIWALIDSSIDMDFSSFMVILKKVTLIKTNGLAMIEDMLVKRKKSEPWNEAAIMVMGVEIHRNGRLTDGSYRLLTEPPLKDQVERGRLHRFTVFFHYAYSLVHSHHSKIGHEDELLTKRNRLILALNKCAVDRVVHLNNHRPFVKGTIAKAWLRWIVEREDTR
jgi:hypothetical protein